MKAAIDAISTTSTSEHVYAVLVKLHGLPVGPIVQSAALTSLGFLYRAYPTLMLLPGSTTIMDAVFQSPTPQTQLQLLRILQDFLASQGRGPASSKKVKAETGVKIEELVGNVDGFADSG
jgi:cohesin loading factor subunit SCC2